MTHYDIYRSLGLDPSADCSRLAADIDRRLSSAVPLDGILVDELSMARIVLGDPYRRSIYDRQLADPTAPDITSDALHQLAEAPPAPVAEAIPTAPPPTSAISVAHGVRQEFRASETRSRTVWLATGAATAAVALAVAAVVWITSPPGTDDQATSGQASAVSSAGEAATESAVTPTVSTAPTTTSVAPMEPVGVASAPKSSHHGDADRNAGEDICGGQVCDIAVLRLSAPVSAKDLTFTQSYDMPVTTITATHPAFTPSFTTGPGDVTNSEYISGVTAYSNGDGKIRIALTNAGGTPTFHPHLLSDGERLVIDVEQ